MKHRAVSLKLFLLCLTLFFSGSAVRVGAAPASMDVEVISYGARDDATLERESRTDPNAQAEWGRRLLIRAGTPKRFRFSQKPPSCGFPRR